MNTRIQTVIRCVLAGLILSTVAFSGVPPAPQKMKPEEVLAKHLESIGPGATRTSVQSYVLGGEVVATVRSPGVAQFNGEAVMASAGNKSVIGFGFSSSNYTQERITFDGKNVNVGYSRPGVRSNLGDFLNTHRNIIKEGLMGGTLSTSWPLLNLEDKKAKLEYRGIKKIGSKQLHELKYYPRGSSDVEIKLFFDSETFQHVRTEYSRVITSQLGATVDTSAIQRTSHYKMIEDFSDFKKEGGLTLPRTYKITLELETRGATYSGTWDVNVNQIAFNQPIQAEAFTVSTK